MTKEEQRIKDFSYRLKELSSDSQDYICNLIHVLLFVEQPPICPVDEKKPSK